MTRRWKMMVVGALTLASPSQSVASARLLVPERVEARLSFGHDSNLLDISDLEQGRFERADPQAYFVVDRMSDQFGEGEIELEWRPRKAPGDPSLLLGWERRQYLHNPIRSVDALSMELRARPGRRTRLDLEASLRPQSYERHRYHRDALPGEPQFRPEVYRRWELGLAGRQSLGAGTVLEAGIEGGWRRYESPFEERDRESFGGRAEISRAFKALEARAGGRYRRIWTENDSWDPDDRSHHSWRASSGVAFRGIPWLEEARLDVELEWRQFTSTNPDDQDHFRRRDYGGQVDLEIVRRVARSLDWVSRGTWRWRSSNFPSAEFDEEGVFEESVFRTGVQWAWERR